MRVIRYQCTLRTGWKMWGRTGWAEPTGRAKDFLPCVIDFLSQKPDFRAPICAVLQVRLFNFDRVEKLGTLIVLQELPSGITDDGTKEPRLVIAARFSLENWDENRKNKEIEALGLLLGIRASPKSDTLREELERKNWNYDLILRIYVLNEILSDSSLKNTNLTGANVSTKLIASFYPLAPREESLKISNFPLWLPDSSEEEDGVLNYTYCLPWLALKERLSSQDSSVIYLIPRAENMDKLKEISDDIWQNNKAKNIVLAAPYGSGKEVLAQVIHYGRSRGNMVSTSVAGVEWPRRDLPDLCRR